jgi:hypothetical protein
MISSDTIERLLQAYREAGREHANAAGDLIRVAEFQKVTLAELMREHIVEDKSAARAEISARADRRYMEIIEAHAEAKKEERKSAYLLNEAQMRIDLIRTNEASRRTELAKT